MDEYPEDDDFGAADDDPVLQTAFIAELERVIGAFEESLPPPRFEWILPVSGIGEVLDVLREAPTALGLAGLEQRLRERFGTLSGLKAIRDDDPDPAV
jgi:hypothetical protein